MTLNELYNKLLKDNYSNDISESEEREYDPTHLDCLLNPLKHSLILKDKDCLCQGDERACQKACVFDAITIDEKGHVSVNDNCVGCEECVKSCESKNLVLSRDSIAVIDKLKRSKNTYALIAPAFIGQFSQHVSPGQLRTAFKKAGFAGMIEVALFADILTLKEAFEFDSHIKTTEDFQLTSCCCPMWIAMIKKTYSDLVPHMPPAVSPMIAAGRVVKLINDDAVTVFIGPCLAKKAEARDADIADAVDHVLTFQEIMDIFEVAGVKPEECEEDLKDHSSAMGRIYARNDGVSKAVAETLNRINPNRKIPIKPVSASGVPACKEMLAKIKSGEIAGNFIEGMGCVGGCVGGPRVIIDREKGRDLVNEYGDKAQYKTPMDNPYVIKLLERLGFETPESLMKDSALFTRKF